MFLIQIKFCWTDAFFGCAVIGELRGGVTGGAVIVGLTFEAADYTFEWDDKEITYGASLFIRRANSKAFELERKFIRSIQII